MPCFLRLLAFLSSSQSNRTNTAAYTNMYIQKSSFPQAKPKGTSPPPPPSLPLRASEIRKMTGGQAPKWPHPCTYAHSPAPYGVFSTKGISVTCFLIAQFDWSFLCAIRHRQPDTEQLRPRRQHDHVRCRSSDYSNSSRWFWFPRDRLGRMVLQIPKTTRYLPLTRQEQLISRRVAQAPLLLSPK